MISLSVIYRKIAIRNRFRKPEIRTLYSFTKRVVDIWFKMFGFYNLKKYIKQWLCLSFIFDISLAGNNNKNEVMLLCLKSVCK